jgi:hypothetical protein
MEESSSENSSEVIYLKEEETMFSDETIAALRTLGAVLEPVYREMLATGKYVVVGGKITKKEDIIEV